MTWPKKFGTFDTPSIIVDGILRDGDVVGRKLRVIHTPGHTPGHISLFSEQERTVIGGDFLMNVSPDGVVAGSEYSIDKFEVCYTPSKGILHDLTEF